MKSLVAIFLTLCSPLIVDMVICSCYLCYELNEQRKQAWKRSDRNPSEQPQPDGGARQAPEARHDEETQSLIAGRTPNQVLYGSHGVGELIKKTFSHLYRKKKGAAWLVTVVTIVFGVFAALITAGLFTDKVATDKAALWSSQHCGVWLYDPKAGSEGAATRASIRDRSREARAGEYAVDCYENPDSVIGANCNFFYEPTIPYKTYFIPPSVLTNSPSHSGPAQTRLV